MTARRLTMTEAVLRAEAIIRPMPSEQDRQFVRDVVMIGGWYPTTDFGAEALRVVSTVGDRVGPSRPALRQIATLLLRLDRERAAADGTDPPMDAQSGAAPGAPAPALTRSLTPVWTTAATLTTVGDGRVELTMDDDRRGAIQVRLPSEEAVLGALLYQPVVVTISAVQGAPAGAGATDDPKSLEEELACARSDAVRLRALLTSLEMASGTSGARFEMARNYICVTCPREDAEKTLAHTIADWLKSRGAQTPEVFEEMEGLRRRALVAEALACLVTMAVYLPSEGKRLGPGAQKLLTDLLQDEEMGKRTQESMHRYIDEHRQEMLDAAAQVDAKEWGGGKGSTVGKKRGEQTKLPLAPSRIEQQRAEVLERAKKEGPPPQCHAARDGECFWKECPQNRDGEPGKTGRHCPYDLYWSDGDERGGGG